jgi:cell division protein FtsA
MTDRLEAPAFATSVGLLRWATLMSEVAPQGSKRRPRSSLQGSGPDWDGVRNWLKRLLP